ncbi:MAG: ATP-binding protein [Marinilabiliales bacterium]|nr:MAG: ATP-binding protein [Marinilabiliales bacterium]
MDYKNFRFGIIIRTLLLAISIFVTIFSSYQHEWYLTTIASGILTLVFLIDIIRYAEKYKRGLSDFLVSIKSRDFISSSDSVSDKKTKDILKEAYHAIMQEFQKIRIEKEVQYHYLKTLVEHVRIALMSYDETGRIQFINKTATDLTHLNNTSNIKQIKNLNPNLYHLIQRLNSGESELIKIKADDHLLHLSIYATEIKIQNNLIKLISFQDIKQELDYQELESWQKLIRVLTHEIMNSVTPISSLSEAINESFDKMNDQSEMADLPDSDYEDMIASLRTIESRSKGLLKFVSSYKQLTRLPKPDYKEVNLIELINHSKTLLKQKIKDSRIRCEVISECDTVNCFIDYDQIEQVIINLLINSIDAVKSVENPEIRISVSQDQINKPRIIITDNGAGIDAEEIDKIFIPFYTTKKEGSGIGLSLSRQIMHLHKGTIQVYSDAQKGTEFILEF